MGIPSIDAGLDKFEHFFSYLVLMLFSSGIVAPERLWRLSIRCFLLGLGLELAQAFWTETRQGDWADLLVNTAGILTAWAMVGGGRAGWAQKLESWLARRRQT